MQNPRNLAQAKARKFKKAYAQMYKMIFSLPTNVPAVKAKEWFNLEYNFEFNIPRNIKDEAETAQKLEGIVSRETQLGVLSIVPDVTQEMERIKDEETESSKVSSLEDLTNELSTTVTESTEAFKQLASDLTNTVESVGTAQTEMKKALDDLIKRVEKLEK